MLVCTECGTVLAMQNDNPKYVVCSFCIFEKADLMARREILFPEKERVLL